MSDTLPNASGSDSDPVPTDGGIPDPGNDDAGADPLTLPLDAWHRAHGGRMVPFAGYWMPVQYEGIIAEHLWTRTHAGLFDVSHMSQLFLSGAEDDRGLDAALEALLPIDLATLKPGGCRYSLLLAKDGGILDDLIVSRWPDGLFVVVNGATKWDDIAHLREHLPDSVAINHMDDRCLLALQGPGASAVLSPLAGGGLDALTFMTGARFTLAGAEVWISRSGYTGEDGFEISAPAEAAHAIADLLAGHAEVHPIGLGARDSLRLEAGLPLYGHDLTTQMEPIAAGLGFAVAKRRRAEGGFPGAERILAAVADGTSTRRVGLALDGRMSAREGATVLAGDAHVGTVTSGGFSPSLGHPIALADIAAEHAAPGTALTVDARGRALPARVVPLPFVPHRYHRTGARA